MLLYEVSGVGGTEDYKTYHYDQHGNTAFILASDGTTITDHVEYSPFGLTAHRTGSTDTPFLYCGAFGVMTDPNGLLYMRARFYNPLMHEFVNADPIGFQGGMNWYAYANGDPINAMDPLGLINWRQVGQGLLETGAGILGGVVLAIAEPVSLGTATLGAGAIFLTVTHGLVKLGQGLADDPKNEELNKFLDKYPTNPGALTGLVLDQTPYFKNAEKVGGVGYDLLTMGMDGFDLVKDLHKASDAVNTARVLNLNADIQSTYNDVNDLQNQLGPEPSNQSGLVTQLPYQYRDGPPLPSITYSNGGNK